MHSAHSRQAFGIRLLGRVRAAESWRSTSGEEPDRVAETAEAERHPDARRSAVPLRSRTTHLDARPTRYLLLYTEGSGMTLDRAAAVLRESGFTLTPGQRGYRARWGNGPELRLAQVDRVAALATVRGACDDDAVLAFLDTVDAVIEVAFDNLEQALDEASTLIESQMQLQAASNGLLVMCWNRVMQLPE